MLHAIVLYHFLINSVMVPKESAQNCSKVHSQDSSMISP